MESLRFEGNTLEQCIKNASDTLHIPAENINYTVLEEKKGLFRKKTVILVQLDVVCDDKNGGSAAVVDGKLIVKNPKEGGKPATVIPGHNIKLIIDGEEIRSQHEILEESNIEIVFYENEAKRHMNIEITSDKMAVFVDIDYKPEMKYELADKEESCSLTLEGVIKEEMYPPLYTKQEIEEELNKIGVKYGIIEDNLNKCVTERKINKILIAEGLPPQDDIDDTIELKFNISGIVDGLSEDEKGRVDYRNVGAIHAVEKGDIIAVKHEGRDGKVGMDVYGNVVKKKNRKLINLRNGEGCIIKDNNTVVAAINGRPCTKNNTFYVYAVHEIQQDVDIKNGNVKFIGDVKIHGGVKDGMVVEAGNTLYVEKNVENAKLEAKGDIEVKGNVICSTLLAGGQDVLIVRYVDMMTELKQTLTDMINTIMEIKKYNLLGDKATDGEMIKALMENKFKNVVKLSIAIISMNKIADNNDKNMVVKNIREKLIGLAPLEIKHFSEIDFIIDSLKCEIEELQAHISLPVDVKVYYSQDSTIDSTGDIYITGKGQYVSKLTANGSIIFLNDKGVARGGTLSAKNEIKCKIVGSSGGVATRLSVDEKGHIWINEAYQNTLLVVGHKEQILEIPSRNVHAYLDDKGELIVDRLNL
jgi:uncharacterized protein (DUF342 family)